MKKHYFLLNTTTWHRMCDHTLSSPISAHTTGSRNPQLILSFTSLTVWYFAARLLHLTATLQQQSFTDELIFHSFCVILWLKLSCHLSHDKQNILMGLFMNPRFTCNHLSHNNISFSPFPFFFSCFPHLRLLLSFFGSTSVQFQLVSYLLLLLLLLDVSGVCRHQMSLQSCWPVLARWSQQSLDKHRHETQPLQKIGSVRVCLCVCVL